MEPQGMIPHVTTEKKWSCFGSTVELFKSGAIFPLIIMFEKKNAT